ncbi:DUF1501 domain-containing protein [Tuwongella immobilis]|uniref:Sulfatase n=1 Tax=Tuwongella immobilis TaxID=692036 RepID=A0A6C2YGP9_9BACT|nr:DUF1501 domain-containing protein [Tuwongella immobilis]VIP00700.1 sulfatase : Uncharacterized protein OS=Chthoniobacter flavus Ellin428 GN=CfE428DRAFT_6606 PE=4 SV=1: DUF1501 [Tuwongella immobilis]VTR96818.1 sulfatase : Uncharacterized protein OS=Chthoniobacter flavus Ellin428 GN=CfE428DRAFT_6606 PE=4 SV=1: DUF1501 [Tuwongella immobilis]
MATHSNDLPQMNRREMLTRSGIGFGMLGLAGVLSDAGLIGSTAQAAAPAGTSLNPLAPKAPHFPVKAKRIIHLFMNGGPSHVDTFDPKPLLTKYHGKALPRPNLPTERPTGSGFGSPFKFQKYGKSGIEVSELFANTARHIDDMCIIRSVHADVPNHEPSLLLMNCGESRLIRPSVGSWMTYGLGTENQNLPGFIAMCPGGYPIQESQNWQAGFLPGVYQGTYIDTQHTQLDKLIENIRNHSTSRKDQRKQLDLLSKLNRQHQTQRQGDPQLEARIQSFELAYRMQIEAADAFDIMQEPESVRERYGNGAQARQILITRRLIERGVRFVQVWTGAGQPWDNHDEIESNHRRLAQGCDQAIAALMDDLKRLGLFDETLIIWGGEFGRTPTVELPNNNGTKTATGRDHNHHGFSMWLAGGGVKGGQVIGATDEFGFQAVEKKMHVHDLHATILALMGFNHENFTFRYAGRDFRLTDVHGNVFREVIA